MISAPDQGPILFKRRPRRPSLWTPRVAFALAGLAVAFNVACFFHLREHYQPKGRYVSEQAVQIIQGQLATLYTENAQLREALKPLAARADLKSFLTRAEAEDLATRADMAQMFQGQLIYAARGLSVQNANQISDAFESNETAVAIISVFMDAKTKGESVSTYAALDVTLNGKVIAGEADYFGRDFAGAQSRLTVMGIAEARKGENVIQARAYSNDLQRANLHLSYVLLTHR